MLCIRIICGNVTLQARERPTKSLAGRSENEEAKEKVKNRTLENHKDAAPSFLPTFNLSATRRLVMTHAFALQVFLATHSIAPRTPNIIEKGMAALGTDPKFLLPKPIA